MIDRELLRRASDLFNRKLYFECHDLLEEVWSEARGEDRDFLQALIHLSVGLYHVAAGNHDGASSLLARAVQELEQFLPARDGLDLLELSQKATCCLEKTERAIAEGKVDWEAEDVPVMRFGAVE